MRWYRLLLHLYPAAFRGEYGDEMLRLYAEDRRQASGRLAGALQALRATLDAVANAVLVHLDLLRADLRFTARTLRRSWGFALTAVLVVALGVGANTAAFSVADFVLLRPLPYPHAERLMRIWGTTPGYGQMELSPPNFRDLQAMNRSFATLGAFTPHAANLVDGGEPQRLQGVALSPELLPLVGVAPLLGRFPEPTSWTGGDRRSLVLSYALWQGRFAGSPDVIGRRVDLDGEPYVVTAVMPRNFPFPRRDVQFWIPFEFSEEDFADRTDNELEVVGRLAGGVSVRAARADLDRIGRRLEALYPKENRGTGLTLYPLAEGLSQKARMLLLALCGAALSILVLAAANLANLLLARAAARERELAFRSALGAGRERLVRQMATESAVLALLGGAAGIAVAAAVPLLASLVPETLPIGERPALDLRVLALAAVLTAVTGLGFGILPAWRVSGARGLLALREGARTGGRGQRTRRLLVAVQVMASVVLVAVSGLLIRALWRVEQVDPGFRAEQVLTLRTALPSPAYDQPAKREVFYHRVLAEIRALPGVESAAYASFLPMAMGGGIWPVAIPGKDNTGEGEVRDAAHTASLRFVTPGFFATLYIPLLAGRDVEEADRLDRPFVAVVSRSFVERYWPGGNPLGQRFRFGLAEREVVGVVADIRVRGLERESEPQVYLPYGQQREGQQGFYIPKDLVVRSPRPVAALVPAITRIVHAADPAQPISDVQTMGTIVARQTGARAAQLRILAALSTVALLLAAVGIHGLLSFAVARRAPEIGVRLALGERPSRLVRRVVSEGLLLAAAGLAAGLVIAYAAGRALAALLFGVQPADPATFTVAAAVALAMTLLGSLLPALGALRTDPLRVMRVD